MYGLIVINTVAKKTPRTVEEIEIARKILEDTGRFTIAEKRVEIKTTVEVEEDLYKRVTVKRSEKRITFKRAVEEALTDWLAKD